MKLALLVAAVDPSVGGVLVFGDRGTGKSTTVRALAALLPKMKAVVGCRYGCDPAAERGLCDDCRERTAHGPLKGHIVPVPVVDLPLGATEDRVVGALDLERALADGVKAFEPGLLARAHRGFLYIDEVNLLEDHLVDLLLDVAASGENVVEREGLSVRHPARFVLIGSGNPEEGELRPQLLDRFGLSVEVRTPDELKTRIEVVKRRDAFERDPEGFTAHWKKEDERIRRRIVAARGRIGDVEVPDAALERAAQAVHGAGHRRAARRADADARRPRGGGAGRRQVGRATRICGGSRRRRCGTGCGAIRWMRRWRRRGWSGRCWSCSGHEQGCASRGAGPPAAPTRGDPPRARPPNPSPLGRRRPGRGAVRRRPVRHRRRRPALAHRPGARPLAGAAARISARRRALPQAADPRHRRPPARRPRPRRHPARRPPGRRARPARGSRWRRGGGRHRRAHRRRHGRAHRRRARCRRGVRRARRHRAAHADTHRRGGARRGHGRRRAPARRRCSTGWPSISIWPPSAWSRRPARRSPRPSSPARGRGWRGVTADENIVKALCGAALVLGVDSLRAPILALRVARAAAALAARDTVADEDARVAARLVLGPRATVLPRADRRPSRRRPRRRSRRRRKAAGAERAGIAGNPAGSRAGEHSRRAAGAAASSPAASRARSRPARPAC